MKLIRDALRNYINTFDYFTEYDTLYNNKYTFDDTWFDKLKKLVIVCRNSIEYDEDKNTFYSFVKALNDIIFFLNQRDPERNLDTIEGFIHACSVIHDSIDYIPYKNYLATIYLYWIKYNELFPLVISLTYSTITLFDVLDNTTKNDFYLVNELNTSHPLLLQIHRVIHFSKKLKNKLN